MKSHFPDIVMPANAITDEKAKLILDSIPGSLVLVDKALEVVAYNRCAAQTILKLLNKMIYQGMPLQDLVPEKRRAALLAMTRKVLRGETCTTQNHPALQREGDVLYENDFLPVRNETGDVTGMLIRSVNITERIRTERLVHDAEERWQFAFEASNQAAWDWNMQTDEIIYSSSYKKMYGFTGEELQNNVWEWKNRIHPDDRGRIEKAVQEHAQSDNPYYETTYRIQLKNGDYKWIMARGKLLGKDGNGKPLRMIGTHTDLTTTLQTKAELKEMNERFHYAAKASSQALWEWNAVTGEAYVSPSFTEMFGWGVDENRRFDQWHNYVHPNDRKETVDDYYRTLEQTEESIWQGSYRFLKADGSYAFVSDKAYIFRDEDKKVIKVIGATQDVTTLKTTEEELAKSNQRYDIVMKATNELVWDWDIKKGEVYRPKDGIQRVYGISNDTSLKTVQEWVERLHPDDMEAINKNVQAVLNGQHMQAFEIEYRFRRDDGLYNDIHARGVLITDDQGQPVHMIGSEQNISERKRLERELLQNELEMKKRINQATVDSQEQERSEIGSELHDNINQVLTTTRLYLELAQANGELKEEMLEKSRENISKVISEIRQLSRSLMDPTIGDLGIVDAINDLVDNVNLTQKVQISLDVDDAIEACLDKKQKLTVFRIIQESLNNVIKHASATFVSIFIQCNDDEALLHITDDGAGFSPDLVKRGAGLKNITNRVYLINGHLLIDSSPGQGCRIKISFPIIKTH